MIKGNVKVGKIG
jgi:hypothetical protein